MPAERIKPDKAKSLLDENAAYLVCAYDSDEKFQANRLDGALSLSEFQSQLDAIPKEATIIFY